MFSRRIVGLAAPVAGVLATVAFASPASAATNNPFGCRASVARVSALNALGAEPYVANAGGSPCATDSAGLSTGTLGLGALGSLTLGPAAAGTNSVDNGADMGASSLASVSGVSIPSPAGAITVVGPAQATAAYECQNGAVQATASSSLTVLTVGGRTITVPAGVPTTIPVAGGSLLVNQSTVTPTSNTERLLSVNIAGEAGVVLGEAQVTRPASNACAGIQGSGGNLGGTGAGSGAGGGNGTGAGGGGAGSGGTGGNGSGRGSGGGAGGGGMGAGASSICPAGSILVPSSQLCEIVTSGSGASTRGIVVSRPDSGEIVGGRVVSLAYARRHYRSICLRGSGPRYAVVGSNGPNRITVAKVRERLLGLGGKDKLRVKSGKNTCVDGGAGNDTITAGNNPVRAYGLNGNDTINAGNGRDFVAGGNGNDHITVGKGRDTVYGNNGNDAIRAGNGSDLLTGGAGNDVIRAGNGNDKVFGNEGNDRIFVGRGRDKVLGGAGNDAITARGRRKVYVSGGRGRNVAFVLKANAAYARRHGCQKVHVMKR